MTNLLASNPVNCQVSQQLIFLSISHFLQAFVAPFLKHAICITCEMRILIFKSNEISQVEHASIHSLHTVFNHMFCISNHYILFFENGIEFLIEFCENLICKRYHILQKSYALTRRFF